MHQRWTASAGRHQRLPKEYLTWELTFQDGKEGCHAGLDGMKFVLGGCFGSDAHNFRRDFIEAVMYVLKREFVEAALACAVAAVQASAFLPVVKRCSIDGMPVSCWND